MERDRTERTVYELDGRRVTSLSDFLRLMGEAVNGPGGYFGRGLDGFADCLRGGFGTPDERGYIVRWRNAEASRRALGYGEMVQHWEGILETCHPENRERVRDLIARARCAEGQTLFDILVGIMRDKESCELHLL